jgi:hypothetical protein
MVLLPTPLLACEFALLRHRNVGLAFVVDGLARFVRDAFRRDVRVTCIHRPPGIFGGGTKKIGASFEVRALPGADRAALRTASPHTAWQAVDVARTPYAPDEIAVMLAFLARWDGHNRLPVIGAARSRTAWLHEAGTHEPHLHVQYEGPPVHAV